MINLRTAALVAAAVTLAACSGHSSNMAIPQGTAPQAQAQAQGPSLGTHTVKPAAVAVAPAGWAATGTQALSIPNATDVGAVAPSQPLTVRVGLQLRNTDQLKAAIASHSQITPATFTSTYGPTSAQVGAVTSYLISQGFTNISVEPNNVLVSADGTAAQAQKAFSTSLHSFNVNGSTAYGNVSPAYVPTSLSGSVIAVLGLNNFQAMHTSPQVKPAQPTPCQVFGVNSPPGTCLRFYDPATYWITYDVGSTSTGKNTSVAVISWGDVTQSISDFRLNEQKFGLQQVPLNSIQVGPAVGPYSTALGEWTLDMTYSSGMAGAVKSIFIYHTASPTDSDIALAYSKFVSQDVAQIGNSSFGECEVYPYLDGGMLVMDELLAQGAAQGQTMFVSTGDTGGGCPANGVGENGVPAGAPMVNYPAASQYVVAVGGTDLFSNPDGTYGGESGWESGGGGVSQYEFSPQWEQTVQPIDAVNIARGLPDVAMDASLETGALLWGGQAANGACTPCVTGGTSLASPLAAGVWARLQTAHGNRLGYAPPWLYANYTAHSCQPDTNTATTLPPGVTAPCGGFHDIESGNDVPWTATPGFDYITGLGSFDVKVMNAQISPDEDNDGDVG